jgi:transketolase
MLQYALLHLYGYALSIDDLKAFRVSFAPHSQGKKTQANEPLTVDLVVR